MPPSQFSPSAPDAKSVGVYTYTRRGRERDGAHGVLLLRTGERERARVLALAMAGLVPASTGVGHGSAAIQPYFVCHVFPHAATPPPPLSLCILDHEVERYLPFVTAAIRSII